MMCLWRMITLSRIVLFHVALSSVLLPQQQKSQKHVVYGHSPPRSSSTTNDGNRYFYGQGGSNRNKNDHYVSFGRTTLPIGATTSSIVSSSLSSLPTLIHKALLNRRRLWSFSNRSNENSNPPQPTSTCRLMATSSSSTSTTIEKDNKTNQHDGASNTGTMSSTTTTTTHLPQEDGKEEIGDEHDNSDIFFVDDDYNFNEEYYTASISKRRRTSSSLFWSSTGDDNNDRYVDSTVIHENELEANIDCDNDRNSLLDTHYDPSIGIVQNVIRIKVQKSHTKDSKNKATTAIDDTHSDESMNRYVESLTQPLMTDRVWNDLTGNEWCTATEVDDEEEKQQLHTKLLNSLARMGEAVARIDTPTDWIDWHPYGTINDSTNLMDGTSVHVWTGKCCATPINDSNNEEEKDRYYGIQLPFIKTRAILPHSIHDVVDLLIDSKKVVTYNPWSLGRKDCWIDHSTTNIPGAITKIVQNRVQPPIPGSRPVVSTTLLHARPISNSTDEDDSRKSWIIVSRSVGCNHSFVEESDKVKATSRSDILLGVNYLEPVRTADGIIDTTSCMITAVTHVYSPSVPLAIAERLGVQSAIKFIQDIRNLKTTTTTVAAPVNTVTTDSAAESIKNK